MARFSPKILAAVGMMYSEMTPATVIRRILLPLDSVNHSAPSGPAAMTSGWLDAVGTVYSSGFWRRQGDGTAALPALPKAQGTSHQPNCHYGGFTKARGQVEIWPKSAVPKVGEKG